MKKSVVITIILSGLTIAALFFPAKEKKLIPESKQVSIAEITCLAENMYHEARNQSFMGKVAVSAVVIQRSRIFTTTICNVVYHGPVKESVQTANDPHLDDKDRIYYPIKNKCQFSWYCDGVADKIDYSSKSWNECLKLANIMVTENKYVELLDGALYYHHYKKQPKWAKKKKFITRIDDHVFYK